MAVAIRLSRQGAKKAPQYMIVAVDTNAKRDGAYLAKLGYYYPKAQKAAEKVKVNSELLAKWLAKGARPTETVGKLLKNIAK